MQHVIDFAIHHAFNVHKALFRLLMVKPVDGEHHQYLMIFVIKQKSQGGLYLTEPFVVHKSG